MAANRKEGGVKAFRLFLLLIPILAFTSCQEEENEQESRIRREVEERVEVIRGEMKISESRWHTVRIVAFCLLAGGSLIWLFNGGGSSPGRSYPLLPDNRNSDPGCRRRVIDRPYDDDEPDDPPYRR
jgi:hypothetical protein